MLSEFVSKILSLIIAELKPKNPLLPIPQLLLQNPRFLPPSHKLLNPLNMPQTAIAPMPPIINPGLETTLLHFLILTF